VGRVAVPYDPDWPRRFEEERARLEEALAPWLEGGIHHIGSTAVPGLAAKPILDMLAGVRNLEDARGAFEPLARLGYAYRPHRPEAHLFQKPGGAQRWDEVTHGVHLTVPGSPLWRERLAFRDTLRADPALAAEYAEWKLQHGAGGGKGPYDADKRPLVARVLAAQGIELKPDGERLATEVLAARQRG
jgi:GrpB-like predicted nucleotidyltransferase (UPF0157 family)